MLHRFHPIEYVEEREYIDTQDLVRDFVEQTCAVDCGEVVHKVERTRKRGQKRRIGEIALHEGDSRILEKCGEVFVMLPPPEIIDKNDSVVGGLQEMTS